ncbi:MAG TPA: hypothetical protein VK044_06345 [Virgibacillus sp.]|nr:hypothetical protein [Virgibacillus sp.]
MRNLLTTNYGLSITGSQIIDGRSCFTDLEYFYITIPAANKKDINMEQAALAYHLVENGYPYTAYPIPNRQQDWVTNYEGENYIVLRGGALKKEVQDQHGQSLAYFHKENSAYHFEPQSISSYGQWKTLWISKLTFVEHYLTEESKKQSDPYDHLLMNHLPYIIGVSENAIQYMQESEQERRYRDCDRGTIAFQRYQDQLLRPTIWSTDLVYDHPTRDIAEYIRTKLLWGEKREVSMVRLFLEEYESVQPLSVFSWRLLYARLIYPIHLFDQIEKSFYETDRKQSYQQMARLFDRQHVYEHHLADLFHGEHPNFYELDLPMLHWIQ